MRSLSLQVAPHLGRRKGLEQALRDAIQSGRLVPGSVLPSTRALASDLGYSRATVVAAYEQLRTEGYLISTQGIGTTVAHFRLPEDSGTSPKLSRGTYDADFRPGAPAMDSFPRQQWHRSAGKVMTAAPDDVFGYPDPRGVHQLRSALADYLARARDVITSTRAVRVLGGYGSAVSFLGEALRRRGVTRVGVEDPTLLFTHKLLSDAGVTPVPIPVDKEGIDVDALQESSVGAVFVTPSNQYPLGIPMSSERKASLVAWAKATDGWIIEDDYDGEFCYGSRPAESLQALEPDRVVYAGTASKSLAPGVRLGWLIVPAELRTDVDAVIKNRGAPSALVQLTLADFIDRGQFDAHMRSTRKVYRARKAALVESLAPMFPSLWSETDLAGLHLTFHLPQQTDVKKLVGDAHESDLGLVSLASHCADVQFPPALVLGYSRPAEHQFRRSLDRLVGFLDERL